MKFLKKNQNINPYIDAIFPVVNAANNDNDPSAINGTAGCLRDENEKLFVYKTVFENESKLTPADKAGYASSPAGNKEFNKAICDYVLENRVSNQYDCVATMGGTGALYTAINMCLSDNDTIIYPEIAWGNYKVIAQENNLNVLTYDVYDLNDLFNKIDMCTDKVFLVINSPCENPLGHSYTFDQWQKIFDKLNNLNKEVVLLIDNAYMDYAYNDPKKFFSLFNNISDNLLVLIATSCSKSFSYYGYRLGALITINNDRQYLDTFINLASRLARATWSNGNNGAMKNVTNILTKDFDAYVKERDESVEMLRKRTSLFIEQANACGLPIYPYTEGFFVTVKIEDKNQRDDLHQKLLNKHIYTIKVNKGIRVGLCSIPLKKINGLANTIRELL